MRKALSGDLPGWEAHSEMINYPRPRLKDVESLFPTARKGGVLVLIYPKDGALHTVLTLRHTYQGHHSAQVSFPGGSLEKEDHSLWHTALREAQEEVGLRTSEVIQLGRLSQVYIPPSNFLVSPYIAVLSSTPVFVRDPVEVARIIETPLSALLDPKNLLEKPMFLKVTQGEVNVRYFSIDGETVWGATGMMLNELSHLLRRTKVTLDH